MNKTKDQQAQEYAEKKIESEYGISRDDFIAAGCRFGYNDVVQAYSDGYTACEQSQWRSVEEGLPEPDTMCLVFGYQDLDFNGNLTRYTMMAWYDGEDFMDAYNDRKYHPVKWMAIPIPETNTEKK